MYKIMYKIIHKVMETINKGNTSLTIKEIIPKIIIKIIAINREMDQQIIKKKSHGKNIQTLLLHYVLYVKRQN